LSYLTEDWVNEHQEYLTSLQSDLSHTVAFLQKAGHAIPEMTSTLDRLEAKVRGFEAQLASHLESLRNAERAGEKRLSDKAEAQSRRLTEKVKQLLDGIDQLADPRLLWELKEKIDGLEQTLSELQQDFSEELAQDRQSLEEAHTDLVSLSNRLDEHIADAQESHKDLREELAEECKARELLEGVLERHRQELVSSLERLDSDFDSRVTELRGQQEQMQIELGYLRRALDDERKAREDLQRRLAKEQQMVQALAERLEAEVARCSNNHRSLAEELSAIRKRLGDFIDWFETSSSWRRFFGRKKQVRG